jgi:hypothetical protein
MYKERHRERRETLAYWPAKDAEKGEAVGLVTNLSEEGIQIHSKHEFRKGQVITMRITVDPKLAKTDHISLVIENVWCRASEVHGLYHAGFRTVGISNTAKKGLRNLFQAFSYPAPSEGDNAEQET